MGKILNSVRRPDEYISPALNKITKPSTAKEITDLLNHDLDSEDQPFETKEVAEWLRKREDEVLTLYWRRNRPRG